MTDCEKYLELMSAMLDGELSSEQEAELRTHIGKCEDCKRVYNAFKGISRALTDELATPPDTLVKGVMFKIKNQKKSERRFAFGRFTALAACLALVLFGASHFGLLDGTKLGSTKKSAAPEATEDQVLMEDSAPENSGVVAEERAGAADADNAEGSGQTMLTSGVPQTEIVDGTVLQYGFSVQNMLMTSEAGTEDNKEPYFLFEAKEILVYEGKYYPEEQDEDKNKLLFTLSTEEDLNALYEFVTALPDNTVEYTPEDGEILKEDPLYTLYIPADTEKDKNAKDKVICIWFVNGEMWCVTADAHSPNPAQNVSAEKILYKAEGVQDKFEALIKGMKEAKGIT
ncbi:MAG: hypothetical protein CVU91_11395 [Firmicutes bacterium HGW-Firmicutes-16]|nr:MAG: hypothetical protein CVU91_11395 [Firmicutes bacterium HGW-Firmicutes-16]